MNSIYHFRQLKPISQMWESEMNVSDSCRQRISATFSTRWPVGSIGTELNELKFRIFTWTVWEQLLVKSIRWYAVLNWIASKQQSIKLIKYGAFTYWHTHSRSAHTCSDGIKNQSWIRPIKSACTDWLSCWDWSQALVKVFVNGALVQQMSECLPCMIHDSLPYSLWQFWVCRHAEQVVWCCDILVQEHWQGHIFVKKLVGNKLSLERTHQRVDWRHHWLLLLD